MSREDCLNEKFISRVWNEIEHTGGKMWVFNEALCYPFSLATLQMYKFLSRSVILLFLYISYIAIRTTVAVI